MLHWNLLYLNCLGFFSDPGYLLLSLLPVPCLEKVSLADRYTEIEGKIPHPAGLIEVSLKKNGKGLSGHSRFTGFAERNVCRGEQQLNLVGGKENDRSSFSVGKLAYL